MWFNFGLIFSVLLCNGCLSLVIPKIESNNDRESSGEEVQQEILTGNSQNKINLDGLNVDVLHLIFNHLNLTDLASIADVKPMFAYYAGQIFEKRYRNYKFASWEKIDAGSNEEDRFNDYPEPKNLVIVDYELALKVLKNFGHLINRLTIHDGTFQENHSQIINKLVNDFYCSKCLTKFSLLGARENTFAQFKKPFEKVEQFDVYMEQRQVGDILPFNTIFPNLRKFEIYINERDVDYSIFDVNLEHLEHLQINVADAELRSLHGNVIDGIIQKNQQIQSAALFGFADNFIVDLNQLLPNVVNLTINRFDLGDQFVHIENVRNFIIQSARSTVSIDHLTFAHLDSIQMVGCNAESFSSWMVFFKNHKHLNRLIIDESITAEQLLEITAELPELVELSAQNMHEINEQTIVQLIQTHGDLMRFQVALGSRLDMEGLHELFDSEWIINYSEANVVSFERKIEEESQQQ